MAAVLACGPGAVLSYRAALALWDLRLSESGLIDVTVPGRSRPVWAGRHSRPQVRGCCTEADCSRGRRDSGDVAGVDNRRLRRRSPTSSGSASSWKRWNAAGCTSAASSTSCCNGLRTAKNIKTLRAAIAEITGPAPWLDSELEQAFHELVRASDLPAYQANVLVEGERVDALWRDERVIVELDGYTFHKSRAQFETDRRRDAKLHSPATKSCASPSNASTTNPKPCSPRSAPCSARRALLGLRQVGDRARGHLGGEHDGLRQRGVGVDRQPDVLGV